MLQVDASVAKELYLQQQAQIESLRDELRAIQAAKSIAGRELAFSGSPSGESLKASPQLQSSPGPQTVEVARYNAHAGVWNVQDVKKVQVDLPSSSLPRDSQALDLASDGNENQSATRCEMQNPSPAYDKTFNCSALFP